MPTDPPILDYQSSPPPKPPVSALAVAAISLALAGCPVWVAVIPNRLRSALGGWMMSPGIVWALMIAPSLLGLILGAAATDSDRRSPGQRGGIGLARAAFRLNLLWLILLLLAAITRK